MSKPKDYEADYKKVESLRQIKARQEPLTVKAATIFRLFKDVYTDDMEEVSEPLPIEVPYCFYSAL